MTDDAPDRKSIMADVDVWREFEARREGTGDTQSEFLARLLDDAEFVESPTADEVRTIVREETRRAIRDVVVAEAVQG